MPSLLQCWILNPLSEARDGTHTPTGTSQVLKLLSHIRSFSLSFFFFIVYFEVPMLLSLIRSPVFIFAFISFALEDRSKKIFPWFTSECFAYFLGVFWCPVCYKVFEPFWIYFYIWCEGVFLFHWVTYSCPVFPAPLSEETLHFPSYTLASFVED